MRDRDGAEVRRFRVLARVVHRPLIALVTAAVLVSAAGCVTATDRVLTVEDVAAERADNAADRVDALLASYGEYLASRWPGIELPSIEILAWLPQGAWRSAFEACATESAGRDVRSDPASGIMANPPPSTDEQLRDFELSIYECQGQFPPPSLGQTDPGAIEIAWISQYVTVELASCLRREAGIVAPAFTDSWSLISTGATPDWDPYALARGDARELRRLQAACPHPSTLLAAIPPAGTPIGAPP